MKKITGPENTTYPILGKNTTKQDVKEMEFVLSNDVVTLRSLLEFINDEDPTGGDGDGSCVDEQFDTLTSLADAYKTAIAASVAKTTTKTDEETNAFVGDCIKAVRFCADDERVDKKMMDGVLRNLNKGYDDVMKQVKENERKGITRGI